MPHKPIPEDAPLQNLISKMIGNGMYKPLLIRMMFPKYEINGSNQLSLCILTHVPLYLHYWPKEYWSSPCLKGTGYLDYPEVFEAKHIGSKLRIDART